jgi:hypothetical protein
MSLWLVLPALALSFGAITFATARIFRHPAISVTVQNSSKEAQSNRNRYVRRGLLSPRLALNLNALGNRLESPGQERLILMGNLRLGGEEKREFAAFLEFPDKLRLSFGGRKERVLIFDGQQTKALLTPADDLDLIETLVYDSAEHFFAAQMQGNATRFLGSRFRMDDGANPDYNGPYFDVYKIADQIKASGQDRPAKLYYFNSDTLLLERVSYVINRDGAEISVETRLSDWRATDGQQVPRRIERFENEKPVFVLTLWSAAVAHRADDGMFVQ